MALKIKQGYEAVIIGFNNSSLPLGQRSQSDLIFFYERAKKRNNQKWLNLFELNEVPTDKEIDAVKEKTFTDKQLRKTAKNER
jgi:hypothetical protein